MDLIKRENVQVCDKAADWRDAIRISVTPLERNGYVEPRYKEEIIGNIEKLGPYIVIADNIALPHARAEQGVLKTQLGVTLFKESVLFDGKDMPARLFVTLAAKDADSHQDALMSVYEIFGDEEKLEEVLKSPDADTLFGFFNQ